MRRERERGVANCAGGRADNVRGRGVGVDRMNTSAPHEVRMICWGTQNVGACSFRFYRIPFEVLTDYEQNQLLYVNKNHHKNTHKHININVLAPE